MNNRVSHRRLIKGARNIDRMRSEINLLIGNLLELINEYSEEKYIFNGSDQVCLPYFDIKTIEGDGFCWIIFGALPVYQRKKFTPNSIRLRVVGGGVSETVYSSLQPELLKMRDVELTHDALLVLTQQVFNMIPKIKEMCEPLIKASSKFSQD